MRERKSAGPGSDERPGESGDCDASAEPNRPQRPERLEGSESLSVCGWGKQRRAVWNSLRGAGGSRRCDVSGTSEHGRRIGHNAPR